MSKVMDTIDGTTRFPAWLILELGCQVTRYPLLAASILSLFPGGSGE